MIRDLLIQLKNSSKTGLICGGAILSYAQWHNISEKISLENLRDLPGKIVGIFLPNGIAYAVSYFACLYADKVIAPFYTGSTLNELAYTVKHCAISTMITTEKYVSIIESLVQIYGIPLNIVLLDDNLEVQSTMVMKKVNLVESIDDLNELNDVVVLLHTSGTTSKPKRVMLTNKGLLHNIQAHCESLNWCENEVCLIQLPMMFGYCNTAQFLAHVYLGACIVINPFPFLAADFYKIVEERKVTNFTAVPSILNILSKHNTLNYDISSLKTVCFGGNPISKEKLIEIMYKFPTIAFVQTYGLTEAGPRVTTLPIQKCNEKVGSVGRAISGVEIKIIDRTGRNLAYGEIGEVLIKSKSIMKGYFRDSEETEKILHSEWLYSGDIGYLSEDG